MTDYSNLTDKEIDDLLATKLFEYSMGGYWKKPYENDEDYDELVYLIEDWNPTKDLNQVWRCEEMIAHNKTIQNLYVNFLIKDCELTTGWYFNKLVHLTARQKCEAMLMALEE